MSIVSTGEGNPNQMKRKRIITLIITLVLVTGLTSCTAQKEEASPGVDEDIMEDFDIDEADGISFGVSGSDEGGSHSDHEADAPETTEFSGEIQFPELSGYYREEKKGRVEYASAETSLVAMAFSADPEALKRFDARDPEVIRDLEDFLAGALEVTSAGEFISVGQKEAFAVQTESEGEYNAVYLFPVGENIVVVYGIGTSDFTHELNLLVNAIE